MLSKHYWVGLVTAVVILLWLGVMYLLPYATRDVDEEIPTNPISEHEINEELLCNHHLLNKPLLDRLSASVRPSSAYPITIITQTTHHRLPSLIAMANQWSPSHIIAVVYVPLPEKLLPSIDLPSPFHHSIRLPHEAQIQFESVVHEVRHDFCANEDLRKHVDIHFVVQGLNYFDTPSHLYPYNNLRNVALAYVETDFLLTMDVDLQPSPNFMDNVDPRELERVRHEKLALVVPLFGMTILDKEGKQVDTRNNTFPHAELALMGQKQMPLSKAELRHKLAYSNNTFGLMTLHISHSPTNFITWLKCNQTYDIDYYRGFEPYVIVGRDIPQYPEEVKGYASDKQAWMLELALRGFKLRVLPSVFVMHFYHSSSSDKAKNGTTYYRTTLESLKLHLKCKEFFRRYAVFNEILKAKMEVWRQEYLVHGENIPNNCTLADVPLRSLAKCHFPSPTAIPKSQKQKV